MVTGSSPRSPITGAAGTGCWAGKTVGQRGKIISRLLIGRRANGVGEPGLVPSAPAIANAVYDAVGVRITDLPITAEKVLKALREKEQAERGGVS